MGGRIGEGIAAKGDIERHVRSGQIPDSGSGTCFHSNRACRLVPACEVHMINESLVVGSVWVWLVPPFPSGFPLPRE